MVKLTFEQRAEANRLIEEMQDDPEGCAFELVALRTTLREARELAAKLPERMHRAYLADESADTIDALRRLLTTPPAEGGK